MGIYQRTRAGFERVFNALRFPSNLQIIIFFVPDVFALLINIIRDNRVKLTTKLKTVLGMLYLIVPHDLIPDYIPGIGWIDDIIIFLVVMKFIFDAVSDEGTQILQEHWAGKRDTLAITRGFMLMVSDRLEKLALFAALSKVINDIRNK